MGPGTLTPGQLKKMDTLHEQMIASGVCDLAQMQEFHAHLQSGR